MANLFTPIQIGPITLRNRTIRSAAFESMCPGHVPSQALYDYHTSVARGGVGMTTVAYAAVTRSGLSFDRQLWMRPEIIPDLRHLTDGIHAEGAKAGIQLGHCGNMSHRSICGCTPVGACNGFNLYSPTIVRGLRRDELPAIAKAFGDSVNLAREAGFDSVEIHCGHGYLIDQFLNTYFNHRSDEYGGTLENRMRFMTMCVEEAVRAAGNDMAVVCKMNMRDGLKHPGTTIDESIQIARRLQDLGVHALVLSGGLVSATPMYVMRGRMPLGAMTYYMDKWWLKWGIRMGKPFVRQFLTPTVPFEEAFFLDDALRFRRELPDMPLIYVGGLVCRDKIDEVLGHGFVAVQMARALLNEPDFVNRMKQAEENSVQNALPDERNHRCNCGHSNYCIGRMYTLDMRCHQHMQGETLPSCLQREIDAAHSPAVRKKNRKGVALVTGADGGMGTEITREVARAGYRVIMVCLDDVHGHDVRDRIVAETGNRNVEVRQCNLSSMDEVCALAKGLLATEQGIDLLMNNAGTMQERRTRTADGFESTVAVNYLAPVLLTQLLRPLLHRGSRVVFMVSLSSAWGTLTYPDFFSAGRKGAFWRILVYSNTKLALSLHLLRLARELEADGITVNGADPGVVSTPIIRMNMWFDPITDLVYRPLIRTPRQGADTAIHLLLSPDVEGQTGHIYHSRQAKSLGSAYSAARQEELWAHTLPLIRKWLQ